MGHINSKNTIKIDANANEILAKSKNSIKDQKAKSRLEKREQNFGVKQSPGCVSSFRAHHGKSVWKIENWKVLASSGKQVFNSHVYGIWIDADGKESGQNTVHR